MKKVKKKDSLLSKMNKYLETHSKTDLAHAMGYESTNFFYSWNKKGSVPQKRREFLKQYLGQVL